MSPLSTRKSRRRNSPASSIESSSDRILHAVYPGIFTGMKKVMVSMPSELLAEVDAEARRLGSNRSAVLRGFAETALNDRRSDRAQGIKRLLAEAGRHGGEAAERVKASRPGA